MIRIATITTAIQPVALRSPPRVPGRLIFGSIVIESSWFACCNVQHAHGFVFPTRHLRALAEVPFQVCSLSDRNRDQESALKIDSAKTPAGTPSAAIRGLLICESSEGKMMTRLLLGAAITATLVLPSAQASSAHRYKRHGEYNAGVMRNAPVHLYGGRYGAYGRSGGYGWQGNPNAYTSGPRWASPNQCFEDLGYGRYESCDW